MTESPRVELAFLRSALQAHLDVLVDTGVSGLPACDEATLEGRRQRHRELGRSGAEAPSDLALAASHSSAAELERAAETNSRRVVAEPVPAPLRPEPDPTERSSLGVVAAPTASLPRVASAAQPAAPGAGTPPASIASLHVAAGAGAEPQRALEVLAEVVRGCTRCDLHRTRTQTVFARGTAKSGICFIGEGPGAEEDAQGLPFVGSAGQLLDKMIGAMGFERDEVYVCNIVKCRPPKNRKPERPEMEACSEYLHRQLELVAPRVIVALGATAVEGLLGLSGIMRLRGRWRLYRGEIPVMPTFHPAYLLRQPEAKRDVWNDLKLVLEHLGLPVPSR